MSQLSRSERGVVSLTVSVVIMIVLSLIVISFAQIMRREQEQSLDRQLNTQAYYAAESAINDARDALVRGILPDKDECTVPGSNQPLSANEVDDNLLAEYTCVTVSNKPSELLFDQVSTDRSTVFEVASVDPVSGSPVNINQMTIGWQLAPDDGAVASQTESPIRPDISWGAGPGMIRAEIVPLPSSGLSRSQLTTDTRIVYLLPSDSGVDTFDWSSLQSLADPSLGSLTGGGEIVRINCLSGATPTTKRCNATINNLPLSSAALPGGYMVRLLSIYEDNEVEFVARTNAGNVASFTGVQAVVDATGKANDVLRRIQERIPLQRHYDYPEYALDIGDDLCKVVQATVDDAAGNSTVTADPIGSSIDSCSI